MVGACTPHPLLPSVLTSQSVPVTEPVIVRVAGIEHVWPTCSVMVLGDWSFMPSILIYEFND